MSQYTDDNDDDDEEMQYAGPVRPVTLKKADIMKLKTAQVSEWVFVRSLSW